MKTPETEAAREAHPLVASAPAMAPAAEPIAAYARVSSATQAQQQTIAQQLERLRAYFQQQHWTWDEERVFLDDGYSGARLDRPGLDRLRDRVRSGEIRRVVLTAPDRLARKYVHQVLLLEEWQRFGVTVVFLERPMSDDPNDQLLLQIRGAVAEYERALIAERLRRGRQMKYRAGQLLPWTRDPYGLRSDPEKPRDPRGVRIEPAEAAHVREIFESYREPGVTLYGLGEHLHALGVRPARGGEYWNKSSLRALLSNPVYTGRVYAGRSRSTPTRRLRSALGQGGQVHQAQRRTAPEEWQLVAHVPAIISQELFDEVQAKLRRNQVTARRNNRAYEYLLRARVSCGQCRLACVGRSIQGSTRYAYYGCGGKGHGSQTGHAQRCPARSIPAPDLDALVWQDLCEVVTHPEMLAAALERAQHGAWQPQEWQARRESLRRGRQHLAQQADRLTEAYLADVIPLAEYQRRRQDLEQRQQALDAQAHQLEAQSIQREALTGMVQSLTEFCQRVQQGLAEAPFERKRELVELLIDRVVVTGDQVEIRYVIPMSPSAFHTRFCHLRSHYCEEQSHRTNRPHRPSRLRCRRILRCHWIDWRSASHVDAPS